MMVLGLWSLIFCSRRKFVEDAKKGNQSKSKDLRPKTKDQIQSKCLPSLITVKSAWPQIRWGRNSAPVAARD